MVSVDGFGDFSSAAWGVGRGTAIDVEGRVHFPHSLGIFYQAMTQYLGFPHYGDEYKVMGLAPYGKPAYLPEMRRIVRLLEGGALRARHRLLPPPPRKDRLRVVGRQPRTSARCSRPTLEELLGPARAKDEPLSRSPSRYRAFGPGDVRGGVLPSPHAAARGTSARQPDAGRRLRHELGGQRQGQARNAVQAPLRAGSGRGCRRRPRRGDPCLAPSLVHQDPRLTKRAAPVALAGDAVENRTIMEHAYLGPAAQEEEIGALLSTRAADLESAGCHVERIEDENELCRKTAEAIAAGGVVGWFQGRMEWGPRALGNRSIVCDPRRADMKDILNLKIKRRESFRPFAPSILREHVAEWFEEDGDVPFMMQVLPVASREAVADPGGDPCRRIGSSSDGVPPDQPALLAAD